MILAFCINIALHVVLGEIVPKTFTLARPEAVALRVAGPVRLFLVVFGPVHLGAARARARPRRAPSACRSRPRAGSRTPRRS